MGEPPVVPGIGCVLTGKSQEANEQKSLLPVGMRVPPLMSPWAKIGAGATAGLLFPFVRHVWHALARVPTHCRLTLDVHLKTYYYMPYLLQKSTKESPLDRLALVRHACQRVPPVGEPLMEVQSGSEPRLTPPPSPRMRPSTGRGRTPRPSRSHTYQRGQTGHVGLARRHWGHFSLPSWLR